MALWIMSYLVFTAIFVVSIIAMIGGAFVAAFAGLEAGGSGTVLVLGFIGTAVSVLILLAISVWSITWMAQRGEGGLNRFGEVPLN